PRSRIAFVPIGSRHETRPRSVVFPRNGQPTSLLGGWSRARRGEVFRRFRGLGSRVPPAVESAHVPIDSADAVSLARDAKGIPHCPCRGGVAVHGGRHFPLRTSPARHGRAPDVVRAVPFADAQLGLHRCTLHLSNGAPRRQSAARTGALSTQ